MKTLHKINNHQYKLGSNQYKKTRKSFIIQHRKPNLVRSFLAIGVMVVVGTTVGCRDAGFLLAATMDKHTHFISPIAITKPLIKEALADSAHSSSSAASFVSATPTISIAPTLVVTPTLSVQDKVLLKTIEVFGSDHVDSMRNLINGESGFNPFAWNKSSGAGGIFQALPFSKTGCTLENVECQINWGMGYIKNRYGNPTNAYKFWLSNSPHWY